MLGYAGGMRIPPCWPTLALLLLFSLPVRAGELDAQLETGSVWFSRNAVRIPGDGGTYFDMRNLTGSGPALYARFYSTYKFNDRHALRLTIAPLETEGTGTLS